MSLSYFSFPPFFLCSLSARDLSRSALVLLSLRFPGPGLSIDIFDDYECFFTLPTSQMIFFACSPFLLLYFHFFYFLFMFWIIFHYAFLAWIHLLYFMGNWGRSRIMSRWVDWVIYLEICVASFIMTSRSHQVEIKFSVVGIGSRVENKHGTLDSWISFGKRGNVCVGKIKRSLSF